jgi:hypothetical protein
MPHARSFSYRSLVAAGLLSLLGAPLAASPAYAAPKPPPTATICRGDLPSGSYADVVVPPKATCSASGSTVSGTFTVGRDATLNGGSVSISGNLIAQGATNVRLTDFTVLGDVIIRDGGGNLVILQSRVSGVVDISGVNGFIAVINNESPGALGRLRVVNNDLQPLDPTSTVGLNISSNQVAADATVSGNKGKVEKNVQGNVVGSTLSCIDNKLPFLGTFNTAAAFQGQCTGPV